MITGPVQVLYCPETMSDSFHTRVQGFHTRVQGFSHQVLGFPPAADMLTPDFDLQGWWACLMSSIHKRAIHLCCRLATDPEKMYSGQVILLCIYTINGVMMLQARS